MKDKPEMKAFHNLIVKTDEPMAKHTSFRVGGPADYFLAPRTPEEMREALQFVRDRGLPHTILGGGTNVLVSDQGIRGAVISTELLTGLWREGDSIIAMAGEPTDTVALYALGHRLSGLEFAYGLPGSIGGAAAMNARAYGVSLADIIECVEVCDAEGKIHRILKEELNYDYKRSRIQEEELIVINVAIHLHPGDPERIEEMMRVSREKRRRAGHYDFPCAGCIFKNDYRIGIPTGKIVDELGLKGYRIGDAAVFEKHANFIVNLGDAKASDVKAVMDYVARRVKEERGITLEPEIKLLGEW
ncbi:MAG: UDP-N-acetylmuramate dehydrogenase [bacterium]